ncbi:MAG: hypothetical protein SFY81_00675 [Verrucomicrobiota bacterium]|nr:hypothetical protein [Verrucomicrobiota bacterium]
MSTAWSGIWQDLNWLGIENPAALPHTSSLFWFILGDDPVSFSKYHVPIALVGLGLSLWVLMRQFGFRHSVCALAAIAAALNMNTFSHSTWGLPSRAWTLASTFLAIAALRSGMNSRPLLKALLAGMAVSNGIMEGFDVGAIFSLYVGAFALFIVLSEPGQFSGIKLGRALLGSGVVAVFAAICAAAALSTLIGTQIKGVAGMEQNEASREQRWDFATMWSLPKAETARVLIPGLFGYRMDTSDGGNYWGSVGQSPGYPTSRHSGSGEYAGTLVLLLACFAVANAFRKKENPYTDFERKCVLFFAGAALVSLLFAWGRHAPFYKLVYSLPYFSTIRNPIKFMHPFHMATLILFGFGLEALFRLYVKDVSAKVSGFKESLSLWWKSASPFEKRWTWGSLLFTGVFLLGSLIYMSSRRDLMAYLAKVGFSETAGEQILAFSFGEIGYAMVFVSIAVLLVIAALSGWFSGKRARLLVIILGVYLAFDLARANQPWIIYYNYKERYASNPIIDFLRQDPHLHRVTARLAPFSDRHFAEGPTAFFAGTANTWLQHHFQYYNIQSLEPVQMPRPPELDKQFFSALVPAGQRSANVLVRMWELSNTRYLLGDRQFLASVPQQLDPGKDRFRIVQTFDMSPKPVVPAEKLTLDDLQWGLKEDGRFALMEFTGALPRFKLYPTWTIATNDQETLNQLASPTFDPHQNVFIHSNIPVSQQPATNFNENVAIKNYSSKEIELTVSNNIPAVLLYNDKYAPNWKLQVNGQPQELLRANFIMRGIFLPVGTHTVAMRYSQPMTGLYISILGISAGIIVLLSLVFSRK